jgi:hypothetical protein
METKKSLKGRTFNALRIIKGASIELIPAMRKELQRKVDLIDGAVMTETETAFEFNNGQFVCKPKQHKEQLGIIKFGPSYATFDGVRIEYKDIELDGAYMNFETSNANYSLHKEII